jgi:hypothetical protein
MIVLQILAIPIVLFLLLCTVFIIASIGTEMPENMNYTDDADQAVNSTLPNIPISRI